MTAHDRAVMLTVSAVTAAAVSLVGTRAVLDFARRHSMLDVPNERSSHRIPTPRGGGLAIVVTVGIAIVIAMIARWLTLRAGLAFFCGGSLIAAVGWADDRRGLPVRARLAAHVAAAGLVVLLLHPGVAPTQSFAERVAVDAGAVLWLVWMTNLYNFMDGIDGLAAGEAIVAGASVSLLLSLSGATGLSFVAMVIAGAAAGFGWYNRPPARIFMGDVGSGALGFLFGCLALASAAAAQAPMYLVPLLLAVFIGDATATLARRVVGRRRWYSAHREHAYQRLVQHGWSHGRVVGAITLINIVLALLAGFSIIGPLTAWAAVLAGVLLVVLAYAAVEWTVAQPNG